MLLRQSRAVSRLPRSASSSLDEHVSKQRMAIRSQIKKRWKTFVRFHLDGTVKEYGTTFRIVQLGRSVEERGPMEYAAKVL